MSALIADERRSIYEAPQAVLAQMPLPAATRFAEALAQVTAINFRYLGSRGRAL
jgi:hypothetical protein